MNQKYIIGMDIGGTNTDAILVDANRRLISSVKTTTSIDITTGFTSAIKQLFKQSGIDPNKVAAINVGTTHATNAILQCQDLYRVGVIRIAGQRPNVIPPCYGWPTLLKEKVFLGVETLSGGFECQGQVISPFLKEEAQKAIDSLLKRGAESLAIIGVFSPMNPEHEQQVGELVEGRCPVSISYEIGGIGFIERENGVILNAALKKVMSEGFMRLEFAKNLLGVAAPLFLTQNNGNLISLEQAVKNPLFTISSGPTNSFIGASLLVGHQNAIVIDIGGTSTDIGMVKKGLPKRSLNLSDLGGVRLNFSTPDLLSLPIGGGSHTFIDYEGKFKIGPLSVGRDLFQQAVSFGGKQITLTDVALKAGYLTLKGANPEDVPLTKKLSEQILYQTLHKIVEKVSLMEGNMKHLPIILVGGGAELFQKEKLGSRFIVPQHAHVANAYGAALAKVMGTIDKVVSLEQREIILEKMREEAIKETIRQGAESKTVEIVDTEIIPYHYTSNQLARVIVRASGNKIF